MPITAKLNGVGQYIRARIVVLILFVLILGSGLVLAVSDAGLPLPGAVLLFAASICLLAICASGVGGYRMGRGGGRGFWRSIGAGFRTAGRAWFELF